MRFQTFSCGCQSRESKPTYFSSLKKYQASSTMPTTIEIELARPAPATPIAKPVPQPAIRIGASAVFRSTVSAWIAIVGLTMPVPRNAEPMTTCAKPSARPGRNQYRYVTPCGLRRGVGRDCGDVGTGERIAADQRRERARDGEQHRLVEHEIRVGAVAAAHGLRDQRDGADSEHLGQRHDHEHQRARRADAGDGRIAEPCDEVEVDQEIQRLEDHAGGHWRGHREDVPDDRALRQVLH